ncbi:transcription factor BIM2-like isoform X2 [Rutidosis leptorrhynchoides]|uniref:transcription factor BIM2-like isoform X2 n=1 Tax=Rutidosis leptorrhynchoides TaxID=125765 RepID=UPI003A9978CB
MEFSNHNLRGVQGRDFLSLRSPAQQDPSFSNINPGGYLKTHDFLQPLEQVVKNVDKEGEHVIPGVIGTYNISHDSYINQIGTHKVPKPEGIVISGAQSSSSNNNDENSNCSSYTAGSGFTLWEESNTNKGKTGKENIAGTKQVMQEGGMKIGTPWMTFTDRTSHSSSIYNHSSATFSSLSSSHLPAASKNRYFVDTMKFGKSVQEEEDHDEVFVIKKEPMSIKVDDSNPDRKPNSPRSKHSATEQRRRSKINDRFSKLRGIIPHGDQKRDKASFLLEVIEYIQFLQEKLHKYEDSSQERTNESPKMIPLVDSYSHNICLQNAACHTQISTHDIATTTLHPSPNLSHSPSYKTDCTITSNKKEDQDVIIESGTISISTIYSQGLSSALTQALKSTGVDLSHAKISVQIDLGKRSNTGLLDSSSTDLKESEMSYVDQSLVYSSGEGFKRLKTSIK